MNKEIRALLEESAEFFLDHYSLLQEILILTSGIGYNARAY
jgi:hypothetical protein